MPAPTISNRDPSFSAEASGRIFDVGTRGSRRVECDRKQLEPRFCTSPRALHCVLRCNLLPPPSGIVNTQGVMGDFNGDGLADPLAFYENSLQWNPWSPMGHDGDDCCRSHKGRAG